ncbi:putative glutathione S-transferase [Xylariales sp. PMI_506]|nr:putative glutathione S-transferase [Xylariales sp. PMI_506]
MPTSQITLFDLASRTPCKTWSHNPWKTRLLLNFKGVDYKTDWTEYPEIRLKLQDHLPLPEGVSIYTIPTIRLPDGKYIMESMEIAKYIEQQYPSPSVHLDSAYIPKVRERIAALGEVGTGLRGVFLPIIPERLLNEKSASYWMETRVKYLGKPVHAITEDERGDKAWENATPNVRAVTEMLKENPGPFFMGETVCYADFFWIGYLIFWKRIGDDVFEKLMSVSGDRSVHLKLLEAARPWTERDDH